MSQLSLLAEPFLHEIQNNFNVIKIYDLLNYDHDMALLREDLRKIKPETFSHNDRIVFLHTDTAYHVDLDSPSLLLHNLIKILYDVDIDFCFTLLVTNQYGIDQHIASIHKKLGCSASLLPVLYCAFQKSLIDNPGNIAPMELNVDAIQHHFCMLNGTSRAHRDALLALIVEQGIDNKGLISYYKR